MDKSKFHNIKEIKKFTIYLGIFLFLIGLVQMFLGRDLFWYFFVAGFIMLVIALIKPVLVKPIFIFFSYLGFYMGKVNAAILLTVFFYLFVTPISFLLKLFGKKSFYAPVNKDAKSYWVLREKMSFEKEDFESQF